MDIDELKQTHDDYKNNVNSWLLYKAAFSGTRALIQSGFVLKKHDRESATNHTRRKEKAYGYNFTKRLIGLINSLLSQKKSVSNYGKLGNDDLFKLFIKNCDYEGSDFERWLINQQLSSFIFGHVGVLIDKPKIENDHIVERTIADNVGQEIYPYLSQYSALNILDWKTNRENGRLVLTYLKLLDDDGNYRLYWQDRWQVWQIEDDNAVLKDEGDSFLGVIPFVWLTHGSLENKFIGVSLAAEISLIDISVIENLSQGEEVIDLTAFPMMRKPMLMPGDHDEDIVGASGVLEFDPNNPNSKPDWLQSQAREPISAILDWIDSKVIEMARMFNASAFFSQSKAAISGESRKREFQLMNSALANESRNLEQFQRQIIYFWLLWEQKEELMKDVVITRPTDFDISDKTEELDNLVTSKVTVNSKTFHEEVDKKIAKIALPDLALKERNVINDEIAQVRDVPIVKADGKS